MNTKNNRHDVLEYLESVSNKISGDLEHIRQRYKKDNDASTAGASGEKMWAELFRKWLPSDLIIETTGRMLFPDGTTSPQVDVVILEPDYPLWIQNEKPEYFLSHGVIAAFESKITISSEEVKEASNDSIQIKSKFKRDKWDPNVGPIMGLLGLTHSWKRDPKHSLLNNLNKHLKKVEYPSHLLDLCCVSDLEVIEVVKFLCDSGGILPSHTWFEAEYWLSHYNPPVVSLILKLRYLINHRNKRSDWFSSYIHEVDKYETGGRYTIDYDLPKRSWKLEEAFTSRAESIRRSLRPNGISNSVVAEELGIGCAPGRKYPFD